MNDLNHHLLHFLCLKVDIRADKKIIRLCLIIVIENRQCIKGIDGGGSMRMFRI